MNINAKSYCDGILEKIQRPERNNCKHLNLAKLGGGSPKHVVCSMLGLIVSFLDHDSRGSRTYLSFQSWVLFVRLGDRFTYTCMYRTEVISVTICLYVEIYEDTRSRAQ